MARKNRRLNKESERFVPSKELQKLLFENKSNENKKQIRTYNKTKSNYTKIS